MRHTKLVSTAMLLVITSLAGAQAKADTPFKVKYERTQELRTGIAFRTIVNILASLDAKGYRADAVEYIGTNLDMSAVEANAFLDQLLVTKQAMEEEISRAKKQHACSEGEAYKILDELYDVGESILDRVYDETKDSLDKNTGILLENWMADEKTTITHAHVDFEKSDELRGTDSTKTLTLLCQSAEQ